MGKRRKFGVNAQHAHKSEQWKEPAHDPRESLVDPSSREYVYDEVDDFHDGVDKKALDAARKMMKRQGQSREQVLGIGGDTSDEDGEEAVGDGTVDSHAKEDDDYLFMEDDIVEERDFMPDERAWGKKKEHYFGTNKMLDRVHLFAKEKEDYDELQMEMEVARQFQDRMAEQLRDLTVSDLLAQDEDSLKGTKLMESVPLDTSSFSRQKKLRLLKQESPEFVPLIEDLKAKSDELQTMLMPLMNARHDGQLPDSPIMGYICTRYQLLLNYICVLCMYISVKCDGGPVSQHPVISRLTQYRQLLLELAPCDEAVAPELKKLTAALKSGKPLQLKSKPSSQPESKALRGKKLRIIAGASSSRGDQKLSSPLGSDGVDEESEDADTQFSRKSGNVHKDSEQKMSESKWHESCDDNEMPEDTKGSKEPEPVEDEKRGINYEIAKNKGLMPSRRKDQRNPRVRYRSKYSKKLKRRKGQVREFRRELKPYAGEITGIKANVIKSIKLQ